MNEDTLWQAVVDRRDDGFLYAVLTTGVYCRPGCASKRPNRDNVRFFPDSTAAETAGFRACKRCRPQDMPGTDAVIERACSQIADSEEMPDLAALAAEAGLSERHFHRLFKQATGTTPKQYAAGLRRARLQQGLAASGSVTEALYDAGFSSASRVYESADALLGMSPARYRAGGAGEAIRFGIAACSLGWVLAAATERGLCVLELGEAPDVLEQRLRRRLPQAELATDASFADLLARVVSLVDDPATGADLPLDLRGTAFQQRVWAALRAIPPGQTISYGDLARQLGIPKAARAVGRAVGSNDVAIAVPCHRVIGSDGTLTGYKWGTDRKRLLLARERK